MRTPARPPLDGLKKRLDRSRAERELKPRDGFLRETFVLPRTDARDKAKEWFDRWPKQAYWTEIENWREQSDDVIEFTMRRLPSANACRATGSCAKPTFCRASMPETRRANGSTAGPSRPTGPKSRAGSNGPAT
jgi:hypothetical protein